MKESFPIAWEKKSGGADRFFKMLRKAAILGMMGLAPMQSVESNFGAYIGHYHEAHTEKSAGEKKQTSLTGADIEKMVLQDESERMFLGNKEGMHEIGGGQKESGFIKFADVQRIIDAGEKSPVIGHTHPLSAYDNAGYSTSEINEARAKNELPAPMPPSLTDIIGSIDTAEYFENRAVEIRERVYDPTGMWEYNIQNDNQAVRSFVEFQKNLNERIEASITEADRQVLKKLGVNNSHPSKRIAVLKSNPDTAAIGKKLERVANDYLEGLPEKTKGALEKFGELEVLCLDIAGAKKSGLDQKHFQGLIHDYIQAGKDIGIQVSYTPRS